MRCGVHKHSRAISTTVLPMLAAHEFVVAVTFMYSAETLRTSKYPGIYATRQLPSSHIASESGNCLDRLLAVCPLRQPVPTISRNLNRPEEHLEHRKNLVPGTATTPDIDKTPWSGGTNKHSFCRRELLRVEATACLGVRSKQNAVAMLSLVPPSLHDRS